VSWCSLIANPTIRRDAASSTLSRYSLPSSVSISVPSPYHLRFTWSAAKSRPIRSGARHRPLPCRVVCFRRRLGRDRKPSSRMILATVFTLTTQPSSRRSAVILGEPYWL
jgi:hypothetical protein